MNESIGQMKFDVIFCRNVFIYFESHQVESISKDILGHLLPHGIYFSGISEPLSGLKLEVQSIGPSAYIHKAAAYAAKESMPFKNQPTLRIVPEQGLPAEEKLIKVLCVDDSPSIHTLLKKILSKENGFEIMGTAMNGADAIEKLKSMKVDVVTLDIHMPIMDGITYLEKHFTTSHPSRHDHFFCFKS
jgi:chemotaxis protein methyltransferase CheR